MSSSQEIEIRVDEDLCALSGMCKRVAPQLFDLPDDADTAVVRQKTISSPEFVALAREAEAGCPTAAILIGRRA